MKQALIVGLLVIALMSMASGLQLVSDVQYKIVYKNGNYLGIVPQQDSSLQADPSVSYSDTLYVIVLTDDGTEEYVALPIYQSSNLEVQYSKIGACMSDSECYSLAQDYCTSKNNLFVAKKPTSMGGTSLSQTRCYRTGTQVKTGTLGYCNAECTTAQQVGVCNSVVCKNDMSCLYGTKSNAACSGTICVGQKCYTYDEGVAAGTVSAGSFCSASMTSTKLGSLCEARCNDKYSSKFHATAASCKSSGELQCGCTQERTIECTSSSGCNNLGIAKCGSLSEVASGYPKCDIERSCGGTIIAAGCLVPCVTAPTVVIPPSEIVPFVCGNGNCEGGETKSSCPLDCGVVSVNPNPTCTPGVTSELKCSGGKKLLQKQVFSSCVEQWNLIQTCPEICENGACVDALTGSITGSDGTITLPTGEEIPTNGADENTTLPPTMDDPDIVDSCGDGVCNTNANEDKTCKLDCPQCTSVLCGGGGGGMDSTTMLLIGGVAGIIILLVLLWYFMKK